MIDKDKLNHAFRLMRSAGLIARQNFKCCCTCAGYKLVIDIEAMSPENRAKIKGVCFYHHQDAVSLAQGDDVFLTYGPVALDEGQIGLEVAEVGALVVQCLT